MIGEADQDMLCSVYPFKSSSSDKCVIEPWRSPCIFVFGKDGDIRGDESTQAREHIPPAGDIGITLCCGGVTEVGNHLAHANSCVWLERAPRIPSKNVDPDSGHSQMDTGNVIQILDVRSSLQDFALDPKPTVLRKISELGAVADRILEVKVGGLKPREAVRSRNAGEAICEVGPNISRHIPFGRGGAWHPEGRYREPGHEEACRNRYLRLHSESSCLCKVVYYLT